MRDTSINRERTSNHLTADLERQKTARQEQSRAAVAAGVRSSQQNHFLSKGALLKTSYSFKG